MTSGETHESEALARRRLLKFGGIAAAGAAATVVASAAPAAALNGNVVLNTDNIGSNSNRTAVLENYANNEVLAAFNGAATGAALRGRTGTDSGNFATDATAKAFGVYGESLEGVGVHGDSGNNVGVEGRSQNNVGVSGTGGSVGVSGTSNAQRGTGVAGTGGPLGFGVSGNAGVGVLGVGTSRGVQGNVASASSIPAGDAAVVGDTNAASVAGVLGTSSYSHGVRGVAGYTSSGLLGSLAAGVVGETGMAAGIGVAAASNTGAAVDAHTGYGVALQATTVGVTSVKPTVSAQSNGLGQAVLAANSAAATMPTVQATSVAAVPAVQATGNVVPAGGAVTAAGNAAALSVQGVASFTRSGVVSIPPGATVGHVAVPGGVTATSHVLATVQNDLGAATPLVRSAVPGSTNGKITINLTAPVPAGKTLKVAWFVFG